MSTRHPLRPMRCPICHKSIRREGNPWRPFCSERCQLLDLGNWMSEEYRIPGQGPEANIDLDEPDASFPEKQRR